MKKKKILLIILLISLILILPGVIYYKYQMYKQTYIQTYLNWHDDDYITKNQTKIDVLKYDLSFDLYPEKKLKERKCPSRVLQY